MSAAEILDKVTIIIALQDCMLSGNLVMRQEKIAVRLTPDGEGHGYNRYGA
jgi:hypothetical protein